MKLSYKNMILDPNNFSRVESNPKRPNRRLLAKNPRAQAVLNLVKFLLSLNLTKGATVPL